MKPAAVLKNGNLLIRGAVPAGKTASKQRKNCIKLKAKTAVMDSTRFMVDSNILISHLNNDLNINSFFSGQDKCEKYINRVVEMETLAKPDMTAKEEADARDLLSGFIRVDMDDIIQAEAVKIRREKILLPDAVIAATAIILNATILSNDPHLLDYKRDGYKALPVPFN
jgi:predicted nucleic acid-binding protein